MRSRVHVQYMYLYLSFGLSGTIQLFILWSRLSRELLDESRKERPKDVIGKEWFHSAV